MWFALQAASTLAACGNHLRILDRCLAMRADTERHRHIPGTPFRHADAGDLQVLVDIGERVLVFLLDPE